MLCTYNVFASPDCDVADEIACAGYWFLLVTAARLHVSCDCPSQRRHKLLVLLQTNLRGCSHILFIGFSILLSVSKK